VTLQQTSARSCGGVVVEWLDEYSDVQIGEPHG